MISLSNGFLFLALALPFIGALFAPVSIILLGRLGSLVLALFPISALAIFFQQSAQVQSRVPILFGFDWIPAFGVRLAFRLDGLSFGFAFLILSIGALVVLYSGGYMPKGSRRGRFFAFILMFMGSMLGLVLADDLITLFVFWELTSITSFLLIGFDHEREAARRGAIQALVITGGGGLALLAGLLLIREATGFTSMSQLLEAPDALRTSAIYGPALLLVLAGAFTKSAQMPFHVWLPNAMEAPTPVSAYLHSATMVKAGIYLLMRMFPVLGGTMLWETILPLFGGVTLVVGAFIEARSCERFEALVPHLDEELGKFYFGLLKSEARHFQGYLKLAYQYGDAKDIAQVIDKVRAAEQELIESPDEEFRFHSGVPVAA